MIDTTSRKPPQKKKTAPKAKPKKNIVQDEDEDED